MKVWIARDGERNGKNDRELWFFGEKPVYGKTRPPGVNNPSVWRWTGNERVTVGRNALPVVKNGECYSAEITLGEKVGES